MSKIACFNCQKGPAEGVSVYRINATGQPGIWACSKHVKNTDADVDPTVKQIVEILDPKAAP